MTDPGVNEQPGTGAEPIAEQPRVSPGAQLAAFREERGWTVEQVASQLNLASRQIVALEADAYQALPGMAIVRGFIRAYAKLLKVDPTPLLATLDKNTMPAQESIVPRKTLATPFSDARLPSMTERSGLSFKWVIGILLGLLLGVAIWAARQGGDVVEIPATSAPQVKDESSGAAPPADANVPAPDLKGQQQEPAPAPVANPAGPVSEQPAAVSGGVAQALAQPAAGPSTADTLQFKAREDSWIEVRRISGNGVLLSRIVRAGEGASVEMSEPVSIVIGNASGVDVTLRGKPVELKAIGASNVARFTLK